MAPGGAGREWVLGTCTPRARPTCLASFTPSPHSPWLSGSRCVRVHTNKPRGLEPQWVAFPLIILGEYSGNNCTSTPLAGFQMPTKTFPLFLSSLKVIPKKQQRTCFWCFETEKIIYRNTETICFRLYYLLIDIGSLGKPPQNKWKISLKQVIFTTIGVTDVREVVDSTDPRSFRLLHVS